MPDQRDGIDDTDPAVAETLSSDHAEPTTPEGAAARSGAERRGPRQVRPGDTLGRYELFEELGEGGMAIVYRARDKELRRDVALKVLFPHLARRTEIVQRFHREARAAAGLEHPNILRIYDVGGAEEDDPPYIVMEYIRGKTLLAEVEQRGPVLAEVVACIGALLADALAAAHKAAIVHRDIKPANVLVAPGGRLLLADFGVARLETEDSLVTKTGALLGTPAYMSPEQASGDIATAKSDLYSLGATLYQLATGALPFTGGAAKVMSLIASGALIAPVKRRAAVGPDLSRIIERLMATEAEARPASAASVAAELRALVTAAGLGDPGDELAAYFADPEAFVRDRTPTLLRAILTAAQAAVDQASFPRAMALADRASGLAPNDPAVSHLIELVARGGRSKRRRKLFAIGGLGLVVVGGGVGALFALHTSAQPPGDAQVIAAVTVDAAIAGDAAVDARLDGVVAADAVPPVDAAIPRTRDAGAGRTIDARGVTMAAIDASVTALPADASPVVPSLDAAPATGAILVVSDAWCEVTIDGVDRGRKSATPFRVDAGHHEVICAQPNSNRTWTQPIEVGAGETKTVRGSLLGEVEVAIEIAGATIDGVPYPRGSHPKLKAGRHRLVAGGVTKDTTMSVACRVLETPELDCYP